MDRIRNILKWYNLTAYIVVCLLLVLLASCSTTAQLPEDEQLYTGIAEIAYGYKAKNKQQKHSNDSTGVITSLAEAYNAVDNLLSGRMDADAIRKQLKKDKQMSSEQRDSLMHEAAILDQASKAVKEEVTAALAYAPNNSLFGSSTMRWPLPIGLWIYNGFANSQGAVGKWFFDTFASTPRTISMANPKLRSQIAAQTLRNFGFFRGRTDFEVQTDARNERKAKVAYSIYPGQLFRFGKIEYQNFPANIDSIIRVTMPYSVLRQGDAFCVLYLDNERKRISNYLREDGFYFFRPEYIAYRADTIQTPFVAHLQVRPRKDMPEQAKNRFYMGRTHVTILPYDDFIITDSVARREFKMRWSGGTAKPPLRPMVILHNLTYRHGDAYKQSLHELMQQNLSSMGVFSSIQVNYAARDTSATCDTLDVNIVGILDKPWDSEFEAKLTNKSNGLLGPGLSYGMTRRNAFRGAEAVTFKIYGSYEWQTGVRSEEADRSLMNSFELGAQTSIVYPRITFFGLTSRKLNRRAKASSNYQLDIDWMTRAGYFQMVDFGARLTYSYQRRKYIRHELTPLRLDYEMLVHRSLLFDSIMNANQALYISMRDQLVPSMAYTFTHSRTFLSGHARTLILGIKQAGNITNTIFTLCGRGRQERDKELLGVPFAQFLKLTGEWRETFPITRRTAVVSRVFAGAVWSYGNSTMAPYSDLFNVGGANSIRAFGIRTVGPGRYHPETSGWSYVNQVGNLKLEANIEYRFPIVSSLYGALFLDAGNVWLMRPDEARPGGAIDAKSFGEDIALGSGFGFRYDLDFLVLRFDIGVGIHAPYETGHSGYYNMPRFRNSLGFHIAVGYPF